MAYQAERVDLEVGDLTAVVIRALCDEWAKCAKSAKCARV